MRIAVGVAAVFVVVGAHAARAAVVLVAAESFDYPAGANPTNGGTGWAGPWAINNVGNVAVAPGLVYPNYPAGSNAMGTTVGGSSISRQLATPIMDDQLSMLFSFLIRPMADGNAISQSTVGNNGGIGQFVLGDLPQGPGPGTNNWGLQSDSVINSSIEIIGGVTTLLVGKVTFGPGSDTFEMWINPTIPGGAASIESKLMTQLGPPNLATSGNLSRFSGIFFQAGNGAASQIDEILVVVDEFVADPVPLPGDFDNDFDVDLTDYLTLSTHLHTDVSGLTPAQSYLLGDMTFDQKINGNDFRGFRFAFDAANGSGAFVEMLAAVPEPSGGLLAAVGWAAIVRRCRR